MAKDLVVYLKTTDTCQLNCSHCFTNGKNGAKIFFNPKQTIHFFKELKRLIPTYEQGHFAFHGGEPMLCPPELMFEAWEGIKDLWPNLWWSTQTNLTYKLTPEKMAVFEQICNKSFGTSWDYNIRWETKKQEQLWEDNVRTLISEGHQLTVMVSLNRELIQGKEPIEIINYMADLGIQHVNFERITNNGNATLHSDLTPSNLELDLWLMKMWEQTKQHKTWEYIDNMFLDSVLSSVVHGTYSGCRSRQCEQKIFTINASGTIGGCPNDATTNYYGTIFDPIEHIFFNPKRMCNIQKEAIRNPICAGCEVYDICNGDCHQLGWQDDICAAPKSLMKNLRSNNDYNLYKNVLNGFMGQE